MMAEPDEISKEDKYQAMLDEMERDGVKGINHVYEYKAKVDHNFGLEVVEMVALLLLMLFVMGWLGVGVGALAGDIARDFCREFERC